MYALTNIKYNGQLFAAGTKVDESQFDEDTRKELIELGALGKVPASALRHPEAASEIEKRDARIKELEALLEEAGVEVPDAFDPADYNVDDVVEYANSHPEDVDAIIEMERAGKNRTTLIEALEGMQSGN